MVPVFDLLPHAFRRFTPHTFVAWLLSLLLVPTATQAAQDDVQIFPQLGHPEYIGVVAVSPDGRTIVTGSADKTLKLWDVASGRELRTLSGHSLGVTAVAISPDGRIIASGSNDHTIRLWDMASGRELRTLEGPTYWMIRTVAFSPDGRMVAAGVWDRDNLNTYNVRFWDAATGRELRRVRTQTQVDAFAISPDGRTVASGHRHGNVLKLWDIASGQELRTLSKNWVVYPIAFSPDGRTVASVISAAEKDKNSGSYSHVNLTLKLWDVASGRELRTQRLGWRAYTVLAFSPDGRTVAAEKVTRVEHKAIEYQTVRLWDVVSGRELRTLGGSEYDPGHMDRVGYTAFAFSPDGRTVAAVKKDRTLKLWDVATGRELRTFASHSHGVRRVALSPDGRTVVSGYVDGTLKLWDVVSGRVRSALAGHGRPDSEHPVDAVAFSPDGRTAVSVSRDDKTLKHWDVATGRELRTFRNSEFYLGAIAISSDARTMVTGSINKPLKIWDVESGREVRTLVDQLRTDTVAFSPDGRIVASSHQLNRNDDKYVIKLWDAASGRELQTLTGHRYSIHYDVAISPDGRTVASADGDRNLKLWDVASGRELRSLNKGYDTDYVRALAFSPDGRTLVSGHLDKTLKFWDVTTGNKLQTLGGHASTINSIVYASDGRTLLSGGEDGTVKLWNLATSKEKVSFVNFKDGEWIAITPEGYYDASEKGDRYLNVRVGGKVYGVDQYREKFYRPDLVKLALAGQPLTGLASIQAVKPAPSVTIVDTPASVSSEDVTVKLRVADQGGGVGDVRLYLNGAAVVLDNTRNLQVAAKPQAGKILSYKLRLVPGKNTIRAIAFNAGNSMQSTDALHEIEARFAARRPSLHALVIGIQEYENPKLTLKYPVADARLVAATLRERAAGLFETIEVTELTARATTTKDSLLKTVKEFQGRVRPDDLFVFYVASHGTVDEGEYYLITSNVGSVSTQALKKDAISQDDLKALIANIPATKKLVVIDTCNAGKLGEALQVAMLTRGMNEETAIKILSRAVGSTILSASSSVQEALEGYEGHGLFTYVVAEGLKGLADLNKDGAVNTLELATYVDDRVPALAERVFKHKQYPLVSPSGQGFPVTRAAAR